MRLVACAILAAGLACPSAAWAKPALPETVAPPAAMPPLSDLKDNEIAAFALVEASARASGPDQAQAMLRRALALVPEPSPTRGAIACTYASWVYRQVDEDGSIDTPAGQKRLLPAIEECYRLLPNSPPAQMLAGMAKVATGRTHEGGLLILAAIKAMPLLTSDIDIDSMKWLMRRLSYARESALVAQLREALVEAGYGKEDSAFFGEMAIEAMASHVAVNENSEAVALLPQVLDPEQGLQLLLDKRFEPIWPIVEHWAGGDLIRQRDAKIAAARAAFRLDPTLSRRRLLADALWSGGQRTEAITLLGQAVNDPKLWDEDRFHIGLLTARYAKMLVLLGRVDEAMTAAKRVNDANPVAEYPMAANLMPNFARLLIQIGRSAEALAMIRQQMPEKVEDEAAYGYYAALRYCAYRRLGKEPEAREQASILEGRYASNQPALRIRDSCSADVADVRRRWVARMLDPQSRAPTLVALVRARLGIKTIGTDELDTSESGQIAASLQAAASAFSRELPASYFPALRMWDDKPAHPAGMTTARIVQ